MEKKNNSRFTLLTGSVKILQALRLVQQLSGDLSKPEFHIHLTMMKPLETFKKLILNALEAKSPFAHKMAGH